MFTLCAMGDEKEMRWGLWWTVCSGGHSLSSSRSNTVTCHSRIGEACRSSGESDVDLYFSPPILQTMAVSTLSGISVVFQGWWIWGGRKDCVDKWEAVAWKAKTPKDKTERLSMKWLGRTKLVSLLKWKIILIVCASSITSGPGCWSAKTLVISKSNKPQQFQRSLFSGAF